MSKKYPENIFHISGWAILVAVLCHLTGFVLAALVFGIPKNMGWRVSWVAWAGPAFVFLLMGTSLYYLYLRQQKESRLAHSDVEHQFRLLVESLPQNVYVKDADGRFIFANQRYCDTEGKSLDKIIGKTDFELHPAELAEKYRADDLRVIETGVPLELEEEHAGMERERCFVQVIKAPFHDSKGQTAGTLGIFWDVTERRVAEQTQTQQRRMLEYHYNLVEILTSISTRFISLPVSQVDVEINRALKQLGEFEKVDRSYVFLFDHERSTMSNTHEWCAPGVEPQIENLKNVPLDVFPWWMGKMNRGEEVYIPSVSQLPLEAHNEREILEPQGVQSLLAVPLISGNALVGFAGFDAVSQPRTWDTDSILLFKIMGDIFASAFTRKATEESIRLIEKRNSVLIENIPGGIVLLDADGRFTFGSPSAYRMFGYLPQEIMGERALRWVHPEDAPRVNSEFVKLVDTHTQTFTSEYRFKHKDGSYRWVEATFNNLLNEPGVNAVVNNFRDITERKQAANQQETSYLIAQAAQNAKSLHELYPRIHEHIGKVMQAANFYIALYDESADTMEFVYSMDEKDTMQTGPQSVGDGFTSHILRTGESLLFKDGQAVPSGIALVGSPAKVWLGVPLMVHGKTIGAMAVQHYSNPNAYTEGDQRMLEFVSTQVATAIERKQNEEVLRRIELRNRALIENAPDGIVMLDMDGRFIFDSPSAARMFGYEPGELLGTLSVERMHPDDRYITMEIRRLFKEAPSSIITRTYRALHKDGSYRWIESTYTNLLGQPGINALVVNFRDVTEQKAAAESLHQSESRFSTIFDNSPVGIAITRLSDDVVLDVNRSLVAAWGYERQDVLGRTTVEIGFWAYPADRQYLLEKLHSQTRVTDFETIFCRKSGEYRNVLLSAEIVDINGESTLLIQIFDITERKLAEEMLQKSQASLEAAQSIARLGSWELEPQSGMGLFWSKEMYRIFHREPAQGVPELEEFMQMVHPDDRQSLLSAQQHAIEDDALVSVEYRAFPLSHEMRYFRASMQATKDGQGKLRHMSGTVLDITENRLMELEIQERVKELTCLFEVSRLLGDRRKTVDIVCSKIIEYIVPAMQFPRLTVSSLTLDDRHYTVDGFDESLSHGLYADIEVDGRVRGQVCVFYIENEPFILPEEQDLLDNIARMLGLWLEQREAEAAMHTAQHELEELNRTLERRVEERTDELRQREATYRALFENSNDGIFLMSPTGEDIAANEQALNMLGYTLKEYLALPPNAVAPDEQQADAAVRFAAVLRGEYVPLYERTFIGKNGEKVEVEINLSPVRDSTGRIIMVQSVVRNITERKKAEEALRESEEQNRLLFEESPDAVTLLDGTGKIIRANRAYEQLTKVPLDKLLGNTAEDLGLVTIETRDNLGAALVRAISRNEPYASVEYVLSCADGRQANVESRIFLLKLGGMDCVLVTTRDITERKKAEKILRESRDKLSAANAALEKASRMKDEFLASMSHELRTPLTGILGLSEAMQMQTFGALNEKQVKALKNIESSGRHLLDLINDILDLSKIEAGKLEMQFEPCQVSDICQSSLQLVKGLANQKKQNMSFSMNPAAISVRADARRLKQMLVNLLSNAVKFTAEGGKFGLDVNASGEQKAIFFSVWDKGIGIKPEEMRKLFKPFTQLDSSLARQYSGTGLGLSLVQRMAELHGGSVKVESTPGEGSRFTIILPWSQGATQPSRDLRGRDTGPLKSALVIEDNELDAEHAVRYLKTFGISHVTQPVLHGALEKVVHLRPSAILLDLNMPDGSGMELLAHLKADERTREIPVIIVSVEEQRASAMKLGAVGYLVKPYTQDELRTELSKAAAFAHPTDPVMVIGPRDSAPLVMIADDNEIILEMVSDFLEANGCRVVAVRSGFELLERVPEIHPDVMLVDIQMPGLDGMETIRRLRIHNDPLVVSTPIIAITALAMSGDREKCLQAGADEYMSKPIALAQLVKRIKEFLEKKSR